MKANDVATVLLSLLVLTAVSVLSIASADATANETESHKANVLLIGAAGFIGFHVMQLLARTHVVKHVVGIDSFNVDYDPILKRERSQLMRQELNITVRDASVCSSDALQSVLLRHRYTHIILLASQQQSGQRQHSSRYSREQFDTMREIPCLETLLKSIILTVRQHRQHLRSSSDVNEVRLPRLIYALPDIRSARSQGTWSAHMRYMERLLLQYWDQYGLTSVGLRFDEVYGAYDYTENDRTSSSNTRHVHSLIAHLLHGSHVGGATDKLPVQKPHSILQLRVRDSERRHYTHVTDAVAAVEYAMWMKTTQDDVSSKTDRLPVLHVTSPRAVDAEELLHTIESILNLTVDAIKRKHVSSSLSATPLGTPRQLVIGNTAVADASQLLRAEQIFAGKISLRDGITDFLKWYAHHQSRTMPCASECRHNYHGNHSTAADIRGLDMCFQSAWDSVAAATRALSSRCEWVVYSVATGATVDQLHSVPRFGTKTCSFAFVSSNSKLDLSLSKQQNASTDSEVLSYGNWTLVTVNDFSHFGDNRKPTRVPKLSPGRFFSQSVKYAIYIDAKLRLNADPRNIIELLQPSASNHYRNSVMLVMRLGLSRRGIFTHFKHIFDRIAERPSITYYRKALQYQKRAYKEYAGRLHYKFYHVFDGAFIVHDLHSTAARDFRCLWYQQYQGWSDRDQVAGAFALAQSSFNMHAADNRLAYRAMDHIPIGEDTSRTADSDDGRRYVYILPHTLWHWMYTEKVATLEYFQWNRADDSTFQNKTVLTPRRLRFNWCTIYFWFFTEPNEYCYLV